MTLAECDPRRYTFRALFTLYKCTNPIPGKCIAAAGYVKQGDYYEPDGNTYRVSLVAHEMLPSAFAQKCNICGEVSTCGLYWRQFSSFTEKHMPHIYSGVIKNWSTLPTAMRRFDMSELKNALYLQNATYDNDKEAMVLCAMEKDIKEAEGDVKEENPHVRVMYGNATWHSLLRKEIKNKHPRIHGFFGLEYDRYGQKIEKTIRTIANKVSFEYGAMMLTFKQDRRSATSCIVCEMEYETDFPDPEIIYGHFTECLAANIANLRELPDLSPYEPVYEKKEMDETSDEDNDRIVMINDIDSDEMFDDM